MKKEPKDVEQWIEFYRLMAELHSSRAARRAREIVFSGVPQDPRPTQKPRPSASREVLKLQRRVWLSEYRMEHPDSSDSKIYRAAGVDRADYYKTTRGELAANSVIVERIMRVIRGGVVGESTSPTCGPTRQPEAEVLSPKNANPESATYSTVFTVSGLPLRAARPTG